MGRSKIELGLFSPTTGMDFIPGLESLEKDVCEYRIYLQEPSARRAELIRQAAQAIADPWTRDYIWQEESFNLVALPDHSLTGRTKFGDCIEDEWLIVWILRELSRQCPDAFVSICDTDGEFLLIESAMHLPRWLDPETAKNRSWLIQGKFVIIEPACEVIAQKQCPDLLLEEALTHLRAYTFLHDNPLSGDIPRSSPSKSESPDVSRLLHDDTIQQDALARIASYPEQSKREMHRVWCRLPRKAATFLHQHPGRIAPACISVYSTSSDEWSPRHMSLQDTRDLVECSIRFTRTLYAQLIGTKIPFPSWWSGDRDASSEIGSKLTLGLDLSGFDLLESATDEEMAMWDQTVDSDDYLHVDFSQVEGMMKGGQDGDMTDDAGVKKMVEQMKKFMASESNYEGAEFSSSSSDDDDEEDEDEDEEDGFDTDDASDEGDFGMDFLRAPVSGSSVMQILSRPALESTSDESDNSSIEDLHEYMDSMDQELSDHGLATKKTMKDDENEDLEIDFELAKNMLESLKGSTNGPALGLLSRLGVSVPRDEPEST